MRRVLWLCCSTALVLALLAGLFATGLVRFNYPDADRFPVRGVDVSHHQGSIDWTALRSDGFSFAFMKATEGATHQDRLFATNWQAASTAGLSRGAYHFFTFCTPGAPQASNFIRTVPPGQPMLPPVADVEYTGNCASPPPPITIRSELDEFLKQLELAYDVKPVIYVTTDAYRDIIAGSFAGYPIWARNIFCEPQLQDGRSWAIWQYADRGWASGISTFIDFNVFNGSRAKWATCVSRGICE